MVAKIEDPAGAAAPGSHASGRPALRSVDAPEKRLGSGDTLPPMPLKSLLSAGGANLFVLSVDAALVDTVQRAGGEQYPVFTATTWTELETAVAAGQCGIALLDADLLRNETAARIAALDAYSHRLVILVAAERAVAQGLMGLLSERKIHRLLMKPAALGITRLLVESAVNRCLQLRDLEAAEPAALEPPAPDAAGRRPRGARLPLWVLATAAGALLVGVAIVGGVSEWRRAAPVAAGAAETAVPPELPADIGAAERFEPLLTSAADAFREGRLAAPPGDNALDHYLAILAAAPEHLIAREQLALVIDALFAQAEAALLADDHAAAAEALANVRRADPASSRLTFLEAQVERARAAAAAARARAAAPPVAPPAVDAQRAELTSLLTIARARVERGQLLEPPGDSAREYLARALQLAPDDREVAALRAALANELVAAARLALENLSLEPAARSIAEARRLGADGEALALLDAELTTARAASAARQHGEWLASAESRIDSGALLEPDGDSAWHFLAQLQEAAPTYAGLAPAWQAWRAAVAADVRSLLAARDWDAAATRLAALERAPQADAIASPLRADLEFGRRQEQYLARMAAPNELVLTARAAPVYPADAERRGIEGWVDIDFVVDATGRPKDLRVATAEPPNYFEASALAAVAQYRFAPFERDGRVYERLARLRIRFTLQ